MGRSHRIKGQAAVEFLCVVPFLFVLMFIAVDVSRVVTASSQAQAVASDTARWCATQRGALQEVDEASALAHAQLSGQLANGSTVSLLKEREPDAAYTMRLLSDDGAVDKAQTIKEKREKITVEVKMPIEPLFPVFYGVGWGGTYKVTGKYMAFATIGREL